MSNKKLRDRFLGLWVGIAVVVTAHNAVADSKSPDQAPIERGRYLTIISGCNDCHSAGFAQSGGTLPESEWLKGDPIGWKGPWGTTYAINLRQLVATISEDAWVHLLKNSQARPPMPSYVFKVMSEQDMRAMYAFIKKLGPAGEAMPPSLPAGQEPKTLHIHFAPVEPKQSKQ